MLCEQCGEQPATVFLTQVIDGASTQRQRCGTCAGPMRARVPRARWTSYTPPEDSARELFARPADCPAEVFLADPVSIADLATALRVHVVQVAAVLMEHGVFVLPDAALDFATASLVCRHYGVAPRKAA